MTVDQDLFAVRDRVVVITGGCGIIGGSLADAFAQRGARVAVLDRRSDAADEKAAALRAHGHDALGVATDVLDQKALEAARDAIVQRWGRVDVLINGAGGNVARARSDDTHPPYDIPIDAFDEVLRLNLHGSVLPSLVFGATMAAQKRGVILNISSMAASRPLSGIMGYSAAKAAIDSFTKWLAVDLARRCGAGLRVNAIAPGFFLTIQNHDMLVNADGSPTARANTIVAHTPMSRFGDPSELHGAALYLCSEAASFVTGVVLPIDGGFGAFSGV